MTEYFYLKGNNKNINKLREYLRALAENPDSGVCILDLSTPEIEELQNKIYAETLDHYQKKAWEHPANANDVFIFENDESCRRKKNDFLK